jgi:hypothetical protein
MSLLKIAQNEAKFILCQNYVIHNFYHGKNIFFILGYFSVC